MTFWIRLLIYLQVYRSLTHCYFYIYCEFFYKPKLLAGKIGFQSLIRKMEIYKLDIRLCHSLVETKIRGCWRHVRRQQRQFVVGINDRPNHGKASLSFVNADLKEEHKRTKERKYKRRYKNLSTTFAPLHVSKKSDDRFCATDRVRWEPGSSALAKRRNSFFADVFEKMEHISCKISSNICERTLSSINIP